MKRSTKASNETHSALLARLTKQLEDHNRRGEIAACKGSAERYAARDSEASALLRGIKVSDYVWGAIFEGTKAAFVRAGLVDEKRVPKKIGTTILYQLPLNHNDGYTAACYGPTYGEIPPSWEAICGIEPEVAGTPKGNPLLSLTVKFNFRDQGVRDRMLQALGELERPDMNAALLRKLILQIPPVPLSIQVPEQIKASKKYPTRNQREAWFKKNRK